MRVMTLSRVLQVRFCRLKSKLAAHMMYTTAPQPLKASRSTAFSSTCEIVSNRSSGSCPSAHALKVQRQLDRTPYHQQRGSTLTRSGSHRPSAIPYNLSCAVPATAKSFGVVIQPILCVSSAIKRRLELAHVSMVEMKGFGSGSNSVGLSSPATMGSRNHGPNLPMSCKFSC